jgi:monoamine oxidase
MTWTMGGSDGGGSGGDELPAGGPLNSPTPVSIVCIGAGVSGIATAIRVQETMENYDLTIFEKNHDLGGTWLENRW